MAKQDQGKGHMRLLIRYNLVSFRISILTDIHLTVNLMCRMQLDLLKDDLKYQRQYV
jgi:hypothetical protein